MPRPASPLDLIHSPAHQFPYPNWGNEVRTYQYFRVFGFHEFRRRASLFDNSAIENAEIVAEAKNIINRLWRIYLPPTSENKDDLNLLGVAQVERVRKGKHVSFQSACLAVVSLELAIQRAGANIDIYVDGGDDDPDAIRICPTLFLVDGYDKTFYETNIANDARNYDGVCRATGQTRLLSGNREDNIFKDMAEPKLISEGLADRFVEHWRPRLAAYTICRPRNGHKFWKRSELEVEVFPL